MMMDELTQGSKEWHEWRALGLGSTAASTILGVNPYMNLERLFLEKTGQLKPEDISRKYAVVRGQALEPYARNLFNEMTGFNYAPKAFVDDIAPELRYSCDGWDEASTDIIEIKCMGLKNHQKVIDTQAAIDYYVPQCLWGMMVSNAKRCWFVSYNPDHEQPLVAIDIRPDPILTKEMRTQALHFWKRILEFRNHSQIEHRKVDMTLDK